MSKVHSAFSTQMIVSNTILHKKNQLFGEKDDYRVEIHKISLKHLVASESNEYSKKTKTHNDGAMSKRYRSQAKEHQWPKLEQFEQGNKAVLN